MAKVIPVNENPQAELGFAGNYGEITGLTELTKQMLYPRLIKFEAKYLPDILIEVQPTTGKGNAIWEFIKKTAKPKIYILTNGGMAFGVDIATGRTFKVSDPNVFKPGALQQFLSSPAGLMLAGAGIGILGYLIYRGLKRK